MYYVVRINGVYDILCGLSILQYIRIPYLDMVHLNMIPRNVHNDIFKRYYAYWILTYGYVRLLSNDMRSIQMSYFIEAVCTANELCNTSDIHREKAIFVIVSSLLLGYFGVK
jgi:hypothetical protein